MVEINGKKLCENCFEEMDGAFCTQCGYPSTGANDPTMLNPGSVLLGKYIVGKIMGKGGFGVTYLAYDVTANKKVAIKEFFPYGVALRATGTTTVSVASMDNAEAFKLGAEKFYNEAKLVAKFNGNPNIVGVYEFFYENDTVYFAMEYLHGHTLKEHIEEYGVLTAAQALFVAQNVANALMAAHSSNVLHRDISPDNIIICDNGDVKLIDFGAARQVVAEHSQSFSVILKPGFAPLEQYQKKGNQGPWTDIYSLGATIYYALTTDIPEDPMSRLDGDEEFCSNQYNVNQELWSVISKATELKIDDRYGDIFEFKNDLSKISIEAEPIIASNEQTADKMPEFQTAMPYGMTQTNASQPVKQPVGVGAPAPAFSPANTVNAQQLAPNGTGAPAKRPNPKLIAICGAAVAVVAAAIIIPIAVTSANKNRTNPPVDYSTPPSQTIKTDTVTDREYTYTASDNSTKTITYTGEWSNNAPNGQGKGVYENGGVYEGEWKDGIRSGKGKHTSASGFVYEGEWKDDLPNGQGKATYANGDVYEGEFKDLKRSGQGKMTYSDGEVYEGEWKDDKKNGQGKMTWANGAVYEGEWKDSQRHGQGKETYVSGDVYEGEWKDDKKSGQGTYTWADGDVYEGEWKDGVRNGYGKFTDKNGKVKEGQWKDDKFVGETVTTVTNKKYGNGTYTGEWSNNMPNGQGKITYASGNVYEGEWKDGKFNGQGKYTWTDGYVYEGEWKDDKCNGKGKMTYSNGAVYEGEWKDDKFNGYGKYTYSNGDVYEGEWKDNKKNGQGKYTWANGSVREGVWKDDKFVG